ncbi:hypothetical protein LUZ60_005682 [Juncus effusus]|nr:hypothetical protein LUZ60_005682 [Juncus effusus]
MGAGAIKGSKYSTFKLLLIKNPPTFLLIAAIVLALLMIFRPILHLDMSMKGASIRCIVLNSTNRNLVTSGKTINAPTKRVEEIVSLLEDLPDNARVGLINMRDDKLSAWSLKITNTIAVHFEPVSPNITWRDLFPSWMDEQLNLCPEIPLPNFSLHEEMDVVIAKLPCQMLKEDWDRDVFRLQVHLMAGNLAAQKGRRNRKGQVKVVFLSECEPMRDIFRCDDLVRREESWWMYEIDVSRLEEKMRLAPGACKLVAPLKREGDKVEIDATNIATGQNNINRREAYATVLHSSDSYVCGAITLAHSIRKTGSTRDLILLHDDSIGFKKLEALMKAGWSLRKITRIRNPNPRHDGLFQYNYSKLRVFQLTDYDKIILIDTDTIVIRNLDVIFQFPAISARSNHDFIFNSGIMVLEPSNCTFNTMMKHIESVKSYNGGDQGFLNEIFVWWHRLSVRTSIFKHVKPQTNETIDGLLDFDPPKYYAIHYFGVKPWFCYRDYDCNYDIESVRELYVSDRAHQWWWRLYDEIDEDFKAICKLSIEQKNNLEAWRREAEEKGFSDGHWRINITDPRKDE